MAGEQCRLGRIPGRRSSQLLEALLGREKDYADRRNYDHPDVERMGRTSSAGDRHRDGSPFHRCLQFNNDCSLLTAEAWQRSAQPVSGWSTLYFMPHNRRPVR